MLWTSFSYEDGWPVLSLTVTSSHQQCTVSVTIIAGCKITGAVNYIMIQLTMYILSIYLWNLYSTPSR